MLGRVASGRPRRHPQTPHPPVSWVTINRRKGSHLTGQRSSRLRVLAFTFALKIDPYPDIWYAEHVAYVTSQLAPFRMKKVSLLSWESSQALPPALSAALVAFGESIIGSGTPP